MTALTRLIDDYNSNKVAGMIENEAILLARLDCEQRGDSFLRIARQLFTAA